MSELTVCREVVGALTTLSVVGDLDIATLPELRLQAERELDASERTELVLDLGGLTFLDSSGLGLFVELRTVAKERGVAVQLANVPPGAARIIEIAGLAETFGLPAP